jgi:hypothetical protein
MINQSLYEKWAKRNPRFEIKYEDSLLRLFTDYGIGASETTTSKGKVFGAGYELYIVAFFIGLYSNTKRELTNNTKVLGQPIQFWGNLDSKRFRKAYPRLREYIFVALVAKTEIDFIALEKGEIKEDDAVKKLINIMEEYANYGFYIMQEKLEENSNYFYKNTSFLDVILAFTKSHKQNEELEEL